MAEELGTPVAACVQCGAGILPSGTRGRPRKRCPDCSPANRKPQIVRTCAECSMTTTRPKYCSLKCNDKAQRRKRDPINRFDRKTPVEARCVVCDEQFARPKKGAKDALKCCSRECGFVLRRWRGENTRRLAQAKAEFAKWSRRAKAPKKVAPAKPGKTCLDCGIIVPKHKQRCAPCKRRRTAEVRIAHRNSEAFKVAKRAAKARRRALERGVDAERFDPFEIFDRDKWRCHLCGVRTPRYLRGTYDDRAPELDHIIPLALGGKHTRINTACSCRKCNGEKGMEAKGQMRLVA